MVVEMISLVDRLSPLYYKYISIPLQINCQVHHLFIHVQQQEMEYFSSTLHEILQHPCGASHPEANIPNVSMHCVFIGENGWMDRWTVERHTNIAKHPGKGHGNEVKCDASGKG